MDEERKRENNMPNNITNQITFGSDSAALTAFQKMLHDMRREGQPLGSFDFNKLLPMPEELNMESGSRTYKGQKLVTEYHQVLEDLERQKPSLSPEEYTRGIEQIEELYQEKRMTDPEIWALGERAYINVQKFGSPTWHDWCNRNWGTKWNAYQPHPLREDDHTMCFFTAWDAVLGIITLLSKKYPEQTITYRWADEDIGYNVGEFILKGGEIIDENVPDGGTKEAYELAAKILGINLRQKPWSETKGERSANMNGECMRPDWTEELCPLATGEVDDCKECYWFNEQID